MEFDLSEKRREMELNSPPLSDYGKGWEDALKRCNEQDKEFIRLLRDKVDYAQKDFATLDIVDKEEVIKIIDKLAGDL